MCSGVSVIERSQQESYTKRSLIVCNWPAIVRQPIEIKGDKSGTSRSPIPMACRFSLSRSYSHDARLCILSSDIRCDMWKKNAIVSFINWSLVWLLKYSWLKTLNKLLRWSSSPMIDTTILADNFAAALFARQHPPEVMTSAVRNNFNILILFSAPPVIYGEIWKLLLFILFIQNQFMLCHRSQCVKRWFD